MWPTCPAASVYAGPPVPARGDAACLFRQTCSRELSHQQPTVDQNIHMIFVELPFSCAKNLKKKVSCCFGVIKKMKDKKNKNKV